MTWELHAKYAGIRAYLRTVRHLNSRSRVHFYRGNSEAALYYMAGMMHLVHEYNRLWGSGDAVHLARQVHRRVPL